MCSYASSIAFCIVFFFFFFNFLVMNIVQHHKQNITENKEEYKY